MTLDEVIGTPAAVVPEAASTEISSLAYDSRAVTPGALYFCVPGFRSDGHDFADAAVAAGAAALVVERPLGTGVPEVVVPSVRAAMGPAAARFYAQPSQALDVVGVTGTNGKTTTAFLVRALLESAGRSCGLLGTVTSFIGGRERPVQRTTAEAIDLQRDLAAMLAGGDLACAMEVSSHALALGRVDGTRFAVAMFTNLTQDHLDFHADMDDYFTAKRRLFELDPPPRHAIVNVDDPYGARLASGLDAVTTFAIDSPADWRASAIETSLRGSSFHAETPAGAVELTVPLPGGFNVLNALGAAAAAHALGLELEAIAAGLRGAPPVPGRLEPVDEGQDFAVLVDYAHTPDSLDNVLRAARELGGGRLLCVFGCGGDRDRGKRPQMGEIAGRLADVAIVTSDNPRSEEPAAIVEEVLAGMTTATASVEAVVDRREAIARAVGLAGAGDVVLIAGKGHEQGQELAGGVKVPFDDVTVAREALRGR